MRKSDQIPKHLKADAGRMWRQLRSDYNIDDAAGLALLQAACEAYERGQEARAAIAKDGAVVADRFGQLRAHPAVAIERDARGQMVSALKSLNFDIEPLRDGPGRPPGR